MERYRGRRVRSILYTWRHFVRAARMATGRRMPLTTSIRATTKPCVMQAAVGVVVVAEAAEAAEAAAQTNSILDFRFWITLQIQNLKSKI